MKVMEEIIQMTKYNFKVKIQKLYGKNYYGRCVASWRDIHNCQIDKKTADYLLKIINQKVKIK